VNKSSQSYEASLAMWDHSVTCHPTQVNTIRRDVNKVSVTSTLQ